jgi:hypothetical protein
MPEGRINTERARKALQEFRFDDLFIDELGWNKPAARMPVSLADAEENKWTATEISQLSGFRVFEVVPDDEIISRPDAKNQQILWKGLTAQAVENIAIFVDPQRTQSLWLWMKRDGKRILPRKHAYIKGQPGDLFLSKLSALVVDLSELDEEGNLPITETANRVRAALDVEVVTKAFFKRFQDVHGAFLEEISGIPDEGERRWYASVILNRLMFIWFLQKKGFVDRADRPDGNRNYLRDKLAASPKGKNQFYSHFLRDLFFEGFAKPENKRKSIGTVTLGDIPYLNGGLFLPHGIEQRIESNSVLTGQFARIKIPDSAFKDVFELFDSYSWNLNDVPGGDDREINPAVLGYIFEKYINQKEFGAYYTRPEITEYLCEQTIHQLVIDAAKKHVAGQQLLVRHGLKKEAPTSEFESVGDVLLRADGSLCRELLQTFLPQLSILDPACGSGAFLVAALKTLLAIYTGLLGRAEAVQEKAVLQWVETEKRKHKAPVAYWLKKKIITENLFGVDIMEEAVEIAKLRLFLALVASAERRDHLEPLPNIEFNLMQGNSLIGLLHIDPKKFDSSMANGGQGRMTLVHEPTGKDLGFAVESKTAPTAKEKVGAHLAEKRAKKYDELLREKNRLVDLYKRSALDFEDLTALKESIEAKKSEARAILDKLLLDEFRGIGIQFESATWDSNKGKEGRSEKRTLKIEDIRVLKPFHWAYEFDEIMVNRGGFDAIITNPPWEIFKPNSKEFFLAYSDLISKKKMRIEEFDEAKSELLGDEEIRNAWLAYLSSYPHLSEWFRAAPQFRNQISIVNGKKAGSDLNYYKLFLEQTHHLLKDRGRNGIVIPSGIYTDLGSTQLRLMLFEQSRVTALFGFENRKAIFENVHRQYKFVVLTFEKGGITKQFPAAFLRLDVADLVTFPATDSLELDVELIKKLSPGSLSLMEFKSSLEVEIAKKMLRYPLLGETVVGGWNVKLSTEFHMTSDSDLFYTSPASGRLPLTEGKMIWQFESNYTSPRYWVNEKEARKRLLSSRNDNGQSLDYQRCRFAFRSIGRNTDQRTLITTVVQNNTFCGNSVSVCTLPTASHAVFLSALANSFVVEWLLRLKVAANINFFYVYQLPIPRFAPTDSAFGLVVERGARLIGTSVEFDDLLKEVFGPKATHRSHGVTDETKRAKLRAEIDAIVAQLYDITDDEFAHILSTFPLVPQEVKTLTLNTFRATLPSAADKVVRGLIKGLETDKVEFKEGTAYSTQRNQKSPDMMRNVLREVAGFLNSGGGNVILGVTDKGKIIGIADDLQHADPKKKNRDGYELFLRNSISGKLGTIQSSSCKISFHKIDNLEVCRIFVPASPAPVYLDGDLIIRDGTSSRQLNAQGASTYISQHWPVPRS